MNLRPIIVNFSFIVISCTQSSMWHAVIIWLFGKILKKITFCSFLTKIDLFSLSIFILSCFVFLEPVLFTIVWNFFFLHSWLNNQLSCSILRKIFTMMAGDYEQIINYDWPNFSICSQFCFKENIFKCAFFNCILSFATVKKAMHSMLYNLEFKLIVITPSLFLIVNFWCARWSIFTHKYCSKLTQSLF